MSNQGEKIGVEELLSYQTRILPENIDGIWIPQEDILTRVAYSWFSYLTIDEILQTRTVLTDYMRPMIYT